MESFHRRGYGFSSQFTVNATAKKMAKSVVGNSMRREHLRFEGDAPSHGASWVVANLAAGYCGAASSGA